MDKNKIWLDLIIELQSLAQAGLTYGKDIYDKERYERIREISAEMMSNIADVPLEKVKGLFCNEIGYQTPKIDTRAAIFKDNKMLRDTVICDESDDTRTHKIFHSLEAICHEFDLSKPIWLDSTIAEFKKHDKARFYQDNFVDSIDFDYLEIHVIEED